jgi:branched-subunit amino acid transport protein AzlD
MTTPKQKMSASYRAIFILSILMVFIVLIAGAATKSKSSGFGMWIWGYTAWLMYKRRNADLVSFYKFLLWFDVIAAVVALSVLTFSDSDVSKYVGYTAIEAIILFVIVISLTFGLYKYFLSIQSHPISSESFNVADSVIWDQVSEEVKSGKRVDSLWTRAFSETDGDSNKANARYIKLRFDQIKLESKVSSSSSSASSVPKQSEKVKLTFFDFWNHFNTVGKLALLGILLLVGYGFLGGNMDPLYKPHTSSKAVVSHTNYDSCVAFLVDKNSNNKLSETQIYCQNLYPKLPKLANSGLVKLTCLDSNEKTFYHFSVSDKDVSLSVLGKVSFIIKSRSKNGLYFESESFEKNTNRPVFIFGKINPSNAIGSITVQYKDKNSNDFVYEFSCSESN